MFDKCNIGGSNPPKPISWNFGLMSELGLR